MDSSGHARTLPAEHESKEQIFVPELAAYQIGGPLEIKDKRVKGIISHLAKFV